MKPSDRWITAQFVIAVLPVFAGCTQPEPVVLSHPPVPPARIEAMPLPPVSDEPLVYQPGHWDWTGNDYRWREGRWVPRDGHGTLWQDGFWVFSAGTWTWRPGYWP